MELAELSTQLKTFDIVDSRKDIFLESEKRINNLYENKRLTRSQSMSRNNGNWVPLSEFPKKKNTIKVQDLEDEIKKIYLNKKVKLMHKNLETIFEDPILRKENTIYLGVGKHKRSLYLSREFKITTKYKSKLRKTKIKKMDKKMKLFKMTDEEFKQKMLFIDNFLNDENITNEESNITEDPKSIYCKVDDNTENCCDMQEIQ